MSSDVIPRRPTFTAGACDVHSPCIMRCARMMDIAATASASSRCIVSPTGFATAYGCARGGERIGGSGGWSGAGAWSGSVDADRTEAASFSGERYTLRAQETPGSGGSVAGGGN